LLSLAVAVIIVFEVLTCHYSFVNCQFVMHLFVFCLKKTIIFKTEPKPNRKPSIFLENRNRTETAVFWENRSETEPKRKFHIRTPLVKRAQEKRQAEEAVGKKGSRKNVAEITALRKTGKRKKRKKKTGKKAARWPESRPAHKSDESCNIWAAERTDIKYAPISYLL
jgi:hypothetical protein